MFSSRQLAIRVPISYLPLQEGGFNSDPFDWIICNAGADIWHALNKSQDGEAYWEADEQWEHHIEHRQEFSHGYDRFGLCVGAVAMVAETAANHRRR